MVLFNSQCGHSGPSRLLICFLATNCLSCVFIYLFMFGLDPEAARVASSKITTTLGLVVHAAGRSDLIPSDNATVHKINIK